VHRRLNGGDRDVTQRPSRSHQRECVVYVLQSQPAMSEKIRDIMTTELETVHRNTTLREVSRIMRDSDIGDVLVTESGGQLIGIVTDRDVVTRGLASGGDVDEMHVGEICSTDVAQIEPGATVADAVEMMTERAVRRVPVVDNGMLVGIVSLGDLARERDPDSALGQISEAPPTH
jgi:CBS domain-containing protein